MASFCKQCSIELFEKDYQELAYLGGQAPTLLPGHGYQVICEGCGITHVDDEGNCLDSNCLSKGH